LKQLQKSRKAFLDVAKKDGRYVKISSNHVTD